MSVAYRFFHLDNGTKKYFKDNNSIMSINNFIQVNDAKIFVERIHAEANIKQLIKTLKNNKDFAMSVFKNKWERFLNNYPKFSGFVIEEVNFQDVFFTMSLVKEDYTLWMYGEESSNYSYVGDETKTKKFYDYSECKAIRKNLVELGLYGKQDINIKHNFIGEF